MNKKHLLISRYLDGELDDIEIAQLAKVLRADPNSVERLVVNSFVHAQLLDWMDQGGAHEQEIVLPVAESSTFGEPSEKSLAVPQSRHLSMGRLISRLRAWGSIAALVFLAASISTVAYFTATRPAIVGQLTEANGAQWSKSDVPIATGTLLKQGQDLVLAKGSAVITFASGAKLYLEGPTSVRLSSANELQLISGRIAAKVPRQAVSFTVTSSLGQVVDLGTEFTLALAAEKSFELYVFEGLVELQLDERFGAAAHQPVRIAQVHAISFDVNSGDVSPMEFEEGKAMPF